MARLVVDLRGRRFGRLVIAQDARSSTRKRKAYWPCVCDCGRKKRVRGAADGCSLSRGARGEGQGDHVAERTNLSIDVSGRGVHEYNQRTGLAQFNLGAIG
jgi:hypothetical protein